MLWSLCSAQRPCLFAVTPRPQVHIVSDMPFPLDVELSIEVVSGYSSSLPEV